MRSPLFPLTAALALGLLALPVSPARGQPKKDSDAVTIDTVDGVELKGTYWASNKGKKGPVAILLHRTGSKSSEDGWKELAEDLQKAGFAVLSFDFRGHGGSVNVRPSFWEQTHNKVIRPRAVRNTISQSDFPRTYWPYLVNDIAAAKRFIERRYNDPGECNLSNVILIGADDGATLGTLWVASEAKRFRIQLPVGNKNDVPESKDVISCIWLTPSAYLGPQGRNMSVFSQHPGWLRDAGHSRDSKVPMAFIYGKEDKQNDDYAMKLVKTLKPAYKRGAQPLATDPLKATGDFGVAGTKLTGAKLLAKDLETRKWILEKYIQGFVIDDSKGLQPWENRESDKTPFVWDFGMRNPIPCNPGPLLAPFGTGKNVFIVPLQHLGIR